MKISLRLTSLLVSVFVIAGSAAVLAAPPSAVPGSADAGRVGGQIAPMEIPPTMEGAGKVTTSGAGLAAPKGAEKVKFTLKHVIIDGMTAYGQKAVEKLYSDMLGKTVTLADVYGIADRLTAKYRNEGYILTQVVVPPQTIENGTVKLRVVEGFVDQVIIQGATPKEMAYMQPFADKIKASRPLNSAQLERYVLLMNDLAGVQARAVISPSPATPGASNITLIVSEKPFDLFSQIDNRGTRYLGPTQVNVGTRLNNLFGFNEGLSLQAVATPEFTDSHAELKFGAFTWSQPVDHEGTKLNFGASVTDTHPGFSLEQFDVHGIADAADVELTHPLIRSRNMDLSIGTRFDYLNSTTTNNLGVGPTVDHLRVLRANATFRNTDSWLGVNTARLEVSKGLDVMDASQKGDANLTRALGDPEFIKETLELSRTQRVTDIFELFAKAEGQETPDFLLASEQLGLGGPTYNTAYDQSEVTGDKGFSTRIELRANNPVHTQANLLQFYTFYDIGKEWDLSNTIASDRILSLADAGVGARANFNENFAGTFEIAKPLTRNVQTMDDEDVRFFGSLTAKY